jgi:hypothetical protein
MANPRAVVDYEGVGVRRLTYVADGTIVFDMTKANGSAQAGLACQITGANTVGLTVDGSDVEGRIERVESDGMVVVQRHGGCSLPGGNGATLTPGSKIVGALLVGGGGGGIRTAASAGDALLARGEILDASTPAAVKVMLD